MHSVVCCLGRFFYCTIASAVIIVLAAVLSQHVFWLSEQHKHCVQIGYFLWQCVCAFCFGALLNVFPSYQYFSTPAERVSFRDVVQLIAKVKILFQICCASLTFTCHRCVEFCYVIVFNSGICMRGSSMGRILKAIMIITSSLVASFCVI